MAQRNPHLFLIEADPVQIIDCLPGRWIHVAQLLLSERTTADNMLKENPVHILRMHMRIEDLIWKNCHNRSLLAQAEAAGADDFHIVLQMIFINQLFKPADVFF